MTQVRFDVHVNSVEGREDCGLPVESESCLGSSIFLPFLLGSEGGDQDGEVANTERNTVLDSTWGCRGKRNKDQNLTTTVQKRTGGETRLWLVEFKEKFTFPMPSQQPCS